MNGCEEKETKYHERAEEYSKRIVEKYPVFLHSEHFLTYYFEIVLRIEDIEGSCALNKIMEDGEYDIVIHRMIEAAYHGALVDLKVQKIIKGFSD